MCRWMGSLHRLFQRRHQGVGVVRGHDAGHVLDADGVRAQGLQLAGLVQVVFQVVHLAAHARLGQGVADRALEVLLVLPDHLHHGQEVAEVVQGVEHPEDVHAVVAGPLHEGLDHVVGVVAVAHQVLPPQQHGQGGAGDAGAQEAQALPGIFVQEAVAGVEGRPAPDLHGVEAHLVHGRGHGQQVLGAPARGEQRLVPVAQGQVLHLHRVGRLGPAGIVTHGGHLHRAVTVALHPLLLACRRIAWLMRACRPYRAQGLTAGGPPLPADAAAARLAGSLGQVAEYGGHRRRPFCFDSPCHARSYSGMFPCFLGGRLSLFPASASRAVASRSRVSAGRITSSTYPRWAAI